MTNVAIGEGLAERLGPRSSSFPATTADSSGGEYGRTGDPDALAAKLREVLITSV